MDLAVSRDGRRLRRSRVDAKSVQLRRAAGTVLVETGVTTLLLLMIWAVAVIMLPVAAAVVSLAGSLVCVGAVATRPVAEPNVADWEEEGAGFGAGEEPVAFIGTVAQSFTYCRTLPRTRKKTTSVRSTSVS